jgi:pyruvyltransferase
MFVRKGGYLFYFYIKIKELVLGIIGLLSSHSHLLNYCIEQNAGDRFNLDFIDDISGIKVKKYTFGPRRHVLFCGSILRRSNKHSVIIGAGFISESTTNADIEFSEVIGVRGGNTLTYIKVRHSEVEPQFLGDPGLLAREVVQPNREVNESGPVGVIPHFTDFDFVDSLIENDDSYKIIDIRQSYRSVCEDIKSCRAVLSSSLHGLIFSDSMNVPNVWVSFSARIKGGDFKFLDYYSVMTNPRSYSIQCRSLDDLECAESHKFVSINMQYQKMKEVVFNFLT